MNHSKAFVFHLLTGSFWIAPSEGSADPRESSEIDKTLDDSVILAPCIS